jgi:hypothetical protein
MNIKQLIIFVTICNALNIKAAQQPCNIFVENYYGFPVVLTVNGQEKNISEKLQTVQINFSHKKHVITSPSLSIKNTAYWPTPISLDHLLQQILTEGRQDENKDKNAIIMVHPHERWGSDLKIDVAWRNPESFLMSFSMETEEEEAKTIERQFQLKKIPRVEKFLKKLEKDSVYGTDYSEKLKVLRELNYDAVRKNNKNNTPAYSKLYSFGYQYLLISIGALQEGYQAYIQNKEAQRTQRGNRDPQEVAGFVKQSIDHHYQLYLECKNNGWLELEDKK